MKLGTLRLFERRVIGEPPGPPLMIRYILIGSESCGVYLHQFLRSDHDRALHDHPWPYVALVLKGGYWERYHLPGCAHYDTSLEDMQWRGPGSLLRRPAAWRHRVVLREGTTSWSLCLVGRRQRRWGFWVTDDRGIGRWCYWRRYNTRTAICEDREIHAAREEE